MSELVDFFMNNPTIEVWPNFAKVILGNIRCDPDSNAPIHSNIIPCETYDNYFRHRYDAWGYVSIFTLKSWLGFQLNGSSGALLHRGQQNVFYCEASDPDHPGFALQAQWLRRDYDQKYRWLILGWQLSRPGVWPDWGTYRPADSKIVWRKA